MSMASFPPDWYDFYTLGRSSRSEMSILVLNHSHPVSSHSPHSGPTNWAYITSNHPLQSNGGPPALNFCAFRRWCPTFALGPNSFRSPTRSAKFVVRHPQIAPNCRSCLTSRSFVVLPTISIFVIGHVTPFSSQPLPPSSPRRFCNVRSLFPLLIGRIFTPWIARVVLKCQFLSSIPRTLFPAIHHTPALRNRLMLPPTTLSSRTTTLPLPRFVDFSGGTRPSFSGSMLFYLPTHPQIRSDRRPRIAPNWGSYSILVSGPDLSPFARNPNFCDRTRHTFLLPAITSKARPPTAWHFPSSSTSNSSRYPCPNFVTPWALRVHGPLTDPHPIYYRRHRWNYQPDHCTPHSHSSDSRTTTHHHHREHSPNPSQRRRHCEFGLPTRLEDHYIARKECRIQPKGLCCVSTAIYELTSRSPTPIVFCRRHHEDT